MNFSDCTKAALLACGLLTGTMTTAAAQDGSLWGKEAEAGKSAKTKWFTDAKFGLFLHWGPYSHFAGDIRGKRYYGITEWIQHRDKTPAAAYAKLAAEFNPTDTPASAAPSSALTFPETVFC